MRRTVLAGSVLAGGLLVAAMTGCSSSSTSTASSSTSSTSAASPGSTAATGTSRVAAGDFCGAVQQDLAVLRSDFVSSPEQASAFLDALRRVQAAAPADLRDQVARMVSAIEKLVASDAAGSTATSVVGATGPMSDEAMEALFSDETQAAAKTFEARVKKDCNIDLSSGGSGSTGTTQPLGSSTPTSEGASATPTLDDLKAAMKAAPGSDAWYPALNGWGIGRVGDEAQITLNADSTDRPLEAAGAVAACEAAAAWANGKYASATITISGPDQKVLASKSGAAGCQPG